MLVLKNLPKNVSNIKNKHLKKIPAHKISHLPNKKCNDVTVSYFHTF